MQKIVLILISAALFFPLLIKKDINPVPPYNQLEEFNPGLAYINSIEKLQLHLDSLASIQHITIGSLDYILLAEKITRKRFYHGFSHFTLNENWIAAISGKLIEEGLACKVKPAEILQQGNAACSQQSIVLMAMLRNKNIDYRKVGFPHHYAMEAMIGNEWYFIDADMEPAISANQRKEKNWNLQSDFLKLYYDTKRFNDLDYKFGNGLTATTGTINEVPAKRVQLFHSATWLLSKTLWLFPLFLLFFKSSFSFRMIFPYRITLKKSSPGLVTA